jgi:prophage regulatory protein
MEAQNSQMTTRKRGRRPKQDTGAEIAKRPALIPPDADRLLRIGAVCQLISMSRAWVYDAIRRGEFPAGVKISERARGWTTSSVSQWIEQRQAA